MAISVRTPVWQHLAIMVVSFALCYVILFAAGFQKRRVYVPSLAQNPWMETTVAYALCLLVAFGLLYFVGASEAMTHISFAIKATVILGLPAVVGGAAGRLIV